MKSGRRLAFDYGSVRIGVGISDSSGIIASPIAALLNDESLSANISTLLNEYQPIYLVVGIPKHLSGNEGQKVSEVNGFVSYLKTCAL